MRYLYFAALIFFICGFSLNLSAEPISKIAFGSCLKQDKAQPIWNSIINEKPDMFIFMGDNIYADTTKPKVMAQKYNLLSLQPDYQRLQSLVPIYATWDDHDYGQNDAGAENPIKVEAEKQFLDFFNVPENSPARQRPGIYQSYYFGTDDQRVQIILLDTRYFRGAPVKSDPTDQCPRFNYGKQFDPEISVLGNEQWEWLTKELNQPATIRFIVSSIQVIPEQHCWEKWANYPLEREKLFKLIADANAERVIILSGDRHLAEVSKLEHEALDYPLIEITSSGMNTGMFKKEEENAYRLSKDIIRENNYGVIEIHWDELKPKITFKINGASGNNLFIHEILLSDLIGGDQLN